MGVVDTGVEDRDARPLSLDPRGPCLVRVDSAHVPLPLREPDGLRGIEGGRGGGRGDTRVRRQLEARILVRRHEPYPHIARHATNGRGAGQPCRPVRREPVHRRDVDLGVDPNEVTTSGRDGSGELRARARVFDDVVFGVGPERARVA